MTGLLAYATYLPVGRIEKNRVVASFDEDSSTLGVAAAQALVGSGPAPRYLYFSTSTPAYADKTNATTLLAALGLPSTVFASDLVGTGRSTAAGLRAARLTGGLVVTGDVRVGKPGSADERGGADGAAALLLGDGDVIAEILAEVSESAEFLDRWRSPLSRTGEQWEERFGFEQYATLVRTAAGRALDAAGIDEADHVVLTSPNAGVSKKAGSLVKGRLSTSGNPVGFLGAGDLAVALAGVLDTAAAGETILLLSAVDGCDAWVLRATELLPSRRQTVPLAAQLAAGRPVPYLTYLSWRGLVERELPRRPEPDRPAGPPSARSASWKFAFTGSRCTACSFLHLPPLRVCRQCGGADAMEPVRAADLLGTVATFTVDRLAFSPSPPVVDVVVDFVGGGRTSLEVADAVPEEIRVGTEVALTFRSLFTAGGVHNYFWKARVR
ncbi:MAG: hydroxymethylglutaryl-CoA synthase [Marmoricola sp.]|nr:hydroxymethylglutaryl-CoA synthase [Marmoricola sp.]